MKILSLPDSYNMLEELRLEGLLEPDILAKSMFQIKLRQL
jgi:hypothetical protein